MDYSYHYDDFDDWSREDDERIARCEAQGQVFPRYKRAVREKHPRWGTQGPLFIGPLGGCYIWQRRGDDIIRGWQRVGIQAEDFQRECVRENDDTSPRLEVPRIIIETMRIGHDEGSNKLRANDIALYWRLFAEARHQGIGNPDFSVSIGTLMAYLGVKSVDRVRASLRRIAGATASYRFGNPDCRGSFTLPLIEIDFQADEDKKIRSIHVIRFKLPMELVSAVKWSRDYAWIDINALPRFNSKYSWNLYFRLCHKAGMLHRHRKPFELGEKKLSEMLGIPYRGAFKASLDIPLILEDMASVDGPRQRFNYIVESWQEPDGTMGYFIEIGRGAKKLKQVKAAPVSEAAIKKLKLNDFSIPIRPDQKPSMMALRQGATLVNRPVVVVDEQWRLDVFGAAKSSVERVIGHKADDFLALISDMGTDKVFEYWLSKRDFGLYIQGLRAADHSEDELEDPPRIVWRTDGPPISDVVEEVDELAVYNGDDVLYGDDEDFMAIAASDDEDIPY